MEIDNKEYKEVKIKKMVIDGEEQEGNIIYAETTNNKQELHVTIYTQDDNLQKVTGEIADDVVEGVTQDLTDDVAELEIGESTVQESREQLADKIAIEVEKTDTDLHKGRGRKIIDELLQKSIFHNRRS